MKPAPVKFERGQVWRMHFGRVTGRYKDGTYRIAPEPWGSGWRYVVVLRAGAKWITGMDPHSGQVARLHIDDWTPCAIRLADEPAGGLRAIVKRRRAMKRHGLWKPSKETKALIRALARSLKPC